MSSLPLHLVAAQEQNLSTQEVEIGRWLSTQQDHMVNFLRRLSNINSGSLNTAGLAQMRNIFRQELESLGFAVSELPGDTLELPHCPGNDLQFQLSDHLLASIKGSGKRLLIMGHLDTVFPLSSPFQTFSQEGDFVYGPGVSDMKGGLVIMLYALKALNQFGLLEDKNLTLLLNSDEEMGSLSSRTHLETQARLHDYGLVYEPSGNNNFTRRRKGLGQARFVVNGRASHAGGAHEEGRSAIKELAYKIIEIEKMTDYEKGLTVNVGLISGGEARNTIAPCAEAFVDLRFPEPEQGVEAIAQFEAIAKTVYSTETNQQDLTTQTWIHLHRPPKIPTESSDYLLNKAIGLGSLLEQSYGITDSGGGTDGSLTQAVGLPTLDSLGIDGSGNHSDREKAHIGSLVQRAKLSALLIQRLSSEL